MIRIIGDIHGKVKPYIHIIDEVDRSIQIGDFGFRDTYKERDALFIQQMIEGDHVFFGGNHDDYHKLPDWHLGNFGMVPFSDNIFYIRGAYSIDRNHRTTGRDWFHEEELNLREQIECDETLEDSIENINTLLTHECPDVISNKLFQDKRIYETTTGSFLSEVYNKHKDQLSTWIFGHWHEKIDTVIDGVRFICLPELGYIDIDEHGYVI